MFPKLYNANETNFIHNGLGLLTGTISAIATEEINSMFELNMEYDSEGFLADIIQEEMIIKAKANDKQDEQLFRIYSITKNHENDNLIIAAQHITYDLGNNFVEELHANNLTKKQVMEQIGSSTAYPHPFNVTSTNTTTQSSTSLYRTNPLQMIGGMEGSVLQIWGGQIERDNFRLVMHDRRGSDDGVLVTYKKNLTGINAKFDISSLKTRIFPYKYIEATDDEPDQLITVPGKYIDSPHINDYEMPYILPVDYSHEEGIETAEDLLNVASGWFVETGRDKPRVEMEVQFEHLWETEEYKDVAALELVGMGDTITVKHSKLKIEGTAIVNRIEYDVIAEKNIAVDVGSVKARFTDKINDANNIVNDINDKINVINEKVNESIKTADGKNTIYYGPDEPTGDLKEGDLWFRVVDGEYTRTYRYDGIQWQLIVSKDVKDIEETANNARNRANEAVENANIATRNATEAIEQAQEGFDKAQESLIKSDDAFRQAQSSFDKAQEAISTAGNAESLASTVSDLAQSLQGTVSGHSKKIIDIEGELSRKMTTIDADKKYATQSQLTQTSEKFSSDIVKVQGNLDNMEIGDRNYYLNTSENHLILNSPNSYGRAQISGITISDSFLESARGNQVTISIMAKSSGYEQGDNPWIGIETTYQVNGETRYLTRQLRNAIDDSNEWKRYSFTVSIPSNAENIRENVTYLIRDIKGHVELKEPTLIIGNKAGSYSQAPEDIQYQFSSINQTISDITTRVGDSEGNISTLQQTAGSLATKISNAEGKISTLTQTVDGFQTRVSNAEGNISKVTQLADRLQSNLSDAQGNISTLQQTASSLATQLSNAKGDISSVTQLATGLQRRVADAEGNISSVTQLANTLQTDLRNAKGDINTLTETASSMQRTITSVQDDLANLDISEINLISKSDQRVTSSSYLVKEYFINEDFIQGEKYTVIFKGSIASGQRFGLWQNVGSNNRGYFESLGNGLFRLTFTSLATTAGNERRIRIYNVPDDSSKSATIEWIKLVRGNKTSLSWQPAPEDMATQSQITQLAKDINLRVKEGDVINQINIDTSGVLLSGKKLILDGDTTVLGTFKVGNANISELNAGKITAGTLDVGKLSVIGLTANSIVGGILSSQNGSTTFNLNNGNLSMGSATLTFGGTGNNFNGRIDYSGEAFRFQRDPYTYLLINRGGSTGGAGVSSRRNLFGLMAKSTNMFRFGLTDDGVDHSFISGGNVGLKFLNGSLSQLQVRNYFDGDYADFRAADVEVMGQLTVARNVTFQNQLIATENSHLYIRPHVSSSNEVRIADSTGTYRDVRAEVFRGKTSGSSNEHLKTNIKKYRGSALDELRNSVFYDYTRKSTGKREIGFIIERETPSIFKYDHEGIDDYTHRSINSLAIKELDEYLYLTREELLDIIERQTLKIADLEHRVIKLEAA